MEDRSAHEWKGIEWTNRTWNPVTGCTKVSQGCKHCYAETLTKRLVRMKNPRYKNGFNVTLHPDKVAEPLRWKNPEWVFVNSMSDMLHADIPDAFVIDVFRVMARAEWHRFQVLTKRPERWAAISDLVIRELGAWPRNVLPGTSVENRAALPRLAQLGAAGDRSTVRMVSVEPLLESVGPAEELAERLALAGIGWVISGGEAGFKARPAQLDWFREVRDACALAGVAFFHKQHGGAGVTKSAKRGGRAAILDGVFHHQMPEVWRGPTPKERRAATHAAAPGAPALF